MIAQYRQNQIAAARVREIADLAILATAMGDVNEHRGSPISLLALGEVRATLLRMLVTQPDEVLDLARSMVRPPHLDPYDWADIDAFLGCLWDMAEAKLLDASYRPEDPAYVSLLIAMGDAVDWVIRTPGLVVDLGTEALFPPTEGNA